MLVAVLANLKKSVQLASVAPADALAEYDAEETVAAIRQALEGTGHETVFLEGDRTLLDSLRQTEPDICFNIAEGLGGDARESHVPALLEMLDIPYTGSKVLTHAISLDKAAAKQLWRDAGLPTAPFQTFRHPDMPLSPRLGDFPLFVKPVREGSGMGIGPRSVVRDAQELREQVRWVIESYRQPALVEGYLPGREFTVGFIGNSLLPEAEPRSPFYTTGGFHIFPVLEIDATVGASGGVYNTLAKSFAIEDANAPLYLCPADISPDLEAELGRQAIAAFEVLDGLDVGRVDFRLGEDGRPYLMEINTLPGLNPAVSDMCIVARAEGVAYELLINEILELACERYGL
ncbi:MAG: hypothetical protein ACLFU8_10840 [Anaerolineales bacterium]